MDKTPLFVGNNLYKGLKNYMAEIGEEYINIRQIEAIDVPGTSLACRNCGSHGPFSISTKDFISEDSSYNFKEVHDAMMAISNLKCNIFTNPDGSLSFQTVGRQTFDISMLADYLSLNCDVCIGQLLECSRCGAGMVEVCPDGIVEGDSIESFGDMHFFCDQPTKVIYDDKGELVHQEITRDGVMMDCFQCYDWENFMEYYEKANKEKKDCYDSLCVQQDMECSISRSFWLFRISQRELMEKYWAWGRARIAAEKEKETK